MLLLSTSFVFTSCLNDDEESAELSDECYISAFTIGQVKRTLHMKGSEGQDSTYQVSISGSLYKMLIDQRMQVITNRDSLPTGTQLGAVLVTLTNKGTVSYAQASDTTEWKNYSSTDSIDLSQPLIFRVTAENTKCVRDYRVEVNVHQADPASYSWTRMTGVRSLTASEDGYRLFLTDGRAVLLSYDAQNGQVYAATSTTTDATLEWTEQPCTGLPPISSVATAQYFGGKFWMQSSATLYVSTDAVAWEEVASDGVPQLVQLVAASPSVLYASMQDESSQIVVVSTTDGVSWNAMAMENGAFTGKPVAAVAYQQTNGNSRVLMADNAANAATSLTVWSLLEGREEPWTLFAQPGDNDYLLPAQRHLNIICYNNRLVTFGGQRLGYDTSSALSACYISRDNGITWKVDDDLVPPMSLRGITGPVAAAAEGEYLWLVVAGQVWRARLNGYGE